MSALNTLIFDVDGTLADTEHAHMAAFNHAFGLEGMDWNWDVATYTRLLEISGGKERILHYWRSTRSNVSEIDCSAIADTIDRLHALKTAAYEQLVQDGEVELRPGVMSLIEEAINADFTLAIATTTSPVNIAALLRRAMGADWRTRFAVIEDASTAPKKKPHPQVYLQTKAKLGCTDATAIAFEDSSNGLNSALAAKLPVIVTHNPFTSQHDFKGALKVLPDLDGISLDQIRTWHSGAAIRTTHTTKR
jgi:HAD superfamily hydrolase (TIGR01509 family)